jgi:hypothetical protein
MALTISAEGLALYHDGKAYLRDGQALLGGHNVRRYPSREDGG